MNAARFHSLLSGQPAVAKRVFDAVPIAELWQTIDIYNELRRAGKARDVKSVEGCLNRLKESGLVLEPIRGHWRRVKVHEIDKPTPSTTPDPEPTMNTTPNPIPVPVKPVKPTTAQPVPAKPVCALDYLAPLAARVNKMAADLKELSSAIETAALEIEQHVSDSATAAQTLAQLRTLLNPTLNPTPR